MSLKAVATRATCSKIASLIRKSIPDFCEPAVIDMLSRVLAEVFTASRVQNLAFWKRRGCTKARVRLLSPARTMQSLRTDDNLYVTSSLIPLADPTDRGQSPRFARSSTRQQPGFQAPSCASALQSPSPRPDQKADKLTQGYVRSSEGIPDLATEQESHGACSPQRGARCKD